MATKFVIKKAKGGLFRFNLLSTNGRVIATSETYASKQACQRGIEAVRNLAVSAPVDDQT